MYVSVVISCNHSYTCGCRWAQFRQSIEEIDGKVQALTLNQDEVKYRNHIGGGFYVTVTSGYPCVDIRKFFLPPKETEVRATRKGVAILLHEWVEMKAVVNSINDKYVTLGTALPCYLQNDHNNQLSALQCCECNPFYQ